MIDTNQPVFSIITPTYKRSSLLKRCISSVIGQTFKDYEHIIVDDANDPETGEVIRSFGNDKLVLTQHATQKGAAGGRNSGILLSRGKFILFLDDDDEYLPLFLERMNFQFSLADAKVGFVWTGVYMVEDIDKGEKPLLVKIWPSKFKTKELGLVAATTIGNGYGLCVRKECFNTIGLYDESIIMGHDADLLFRLVRHFDFETIPQPLVRIHQHGTSQLTNERNNLHRLDLREKILQKNLDLLNKFPKLYFVHYKHIADLSYNLNLKGKGRQTMFDLIKHSPSRILNYVDLIFYELFGKDTKSFLYGSRLRRLVQLMKVPVRYYL